MRWWRPQPFAKRNGSQPTKIPETAITTATAAREERWVLLARSIPTEGNRHHHPLRRLLGVLENAARNARGPRLQQTRKREQQQRLRPRLSRRRPIRRSQQEECSPP